MNLVVSTFLPVILAFCLAGCATSIVSGTAQGGGYTDGSARPDADIYHDRSITSAISSRYVKDDLVSAFDVNVSSYRGTVTLNGTVPSQLAAQRAVELARSVQGVRQVISKLTVVSSPSN